MATEVGYANGITENPTYQEVCADNTQFAETVHVTYDPKVASLEFLLNLYFMAIDPTSINSRGTTWVRSIERAYITPTRPTCR